MLGAIGFFQLAFGLFLHKYIDWLMNTAGFYSNYLAHTILHSHPSTPSFVKLVQNLRCSQCLSSLFLKTFKDSAVTTCSGRPFQRLMILFVKKIFELVSVKTVFVKFERVRRRGRRRI